MLPPRNVCKFNVNSCVGPGNEDDLWPASAVSLCPGVLFIHLEAGRQPGYLATQLQHKTAQSKTTEVHYLLWEKKTRWLLATKANMCPWFHRLPGWAEIRSYMIFTDIYWWQAGNTTTSTDLISVKPLPRAGTDHFISLNYFINWSKIFSLILNIMKSWWCWLSQAACCKICAELIRIWWHKDWEQGELAQLKVKKYIFQA